MLFISHVYVTYIHSLYILHVHSLYHVISHIHLIDDDHRCSRVLGVHQRPVLENLRHALVGLLDDLRQGLMVLDLRATTQTKVLLSCCYKVCLFVCFVVRLSSYVCHWFLGFRTLSLRRDKHWSQWMGAEPSVLVYAYATTKQASLPQRNL